MYALSGSSVSAANDVFLSYARADGGRPLLTRTISEGFALIIMLMQVG